LLEVKESIFNQMAQFVEFFIIVSLNFPILLWRNYCLHSSGDRLLQNRICVVATVGE